MEINNQIINQKSSSKPGLRKFLLVVYSIALVLSLIFAVISLAVVSGDGYKVIRYGISFSSLLIPIFIIIAMSLSKKSLLWFLFPLLPLLAFIIFNILSNNKMLDSNAEFCRQAILRNDRSILDNPTLDCNKLIKS